MKINVLGIEKKCKSTDKIIFTDYDVALNNTRTLYRKTKINYNVYKCKFCKNYHIGHFHEY